MASKGNLTNKTLSGVMWKFGERFSAQLVTTLVSIILARLLTPDDFGSVALIMIFINICNVFVVSGFGTSLVQKKNADDLDFTSVFWASLILAFLLYGVIFLCAPYVAKFYGKEILTPVLRVMAIRIPISAINSVQHAIISRRMQFKKFFIATIFGTIISGFVGIWMAYAGYGVWAIVGQYMTNCVIDTLVLVVVVRWLPRLKVSFKRLKVLFGYGWKLLVSGLIDTGYNELRSLIIGKKYSSSDLGYYNKGRNFPYVVASNLDAAINPVLFATMTKIQSDRQKVKESTRRSIQVCSFVILPCMIGLACLGETFISVVLTDKWMPALPYLYIMCLTYMFYPIHTANLTAINAVGRSDLYLKLEVFKKVIGLAIILASMWFGVFWMALSSLLGTIISSFINAFPNKKLLNYNYFEQIKDILPSFMCAVLMGIPVFFMNGLAINKALLLILQIITGIVLYILINLITRNKIFFYVLKLAKNFIKSRKKQKCVKVKKAGQIYKFIAKKYNVTDKAKAIALAKELLENNQVYIVVKGKEVLGLIGYYETQGVANLKVLVKEKGQDCEEILLNAVIKECSEKNLTKFVCITSSSKDSNFENYLIQKFAFTLNDGALELELANTKKDEVVEKDNAIKEEQTEISEEQTENNKKEENDD